MIDTKLNNSPIDQKEIKLIGRQLTLLMQNYVRPIIFEDISEKTKKFCIKNGTVTFVKTNKCCFGITNYHVVKGVMEATKFNGKIYCQIEQILIKDISSRIIDQDEKLDIATLCFSEKEINAICPNPYSPRIWPSELPKAGDFSVVVGYPATLKRIEAQDQLVIPHIGLAMSIHAITDTKITLQFEREYWITDKGKIDPSKLSDFGGISGSGIFTMKLAAELIGIVTDHQEDYDLLYCTRIDFVQDDGTIKHIVV
jgi:hypothetical protein